MDELKNFGKIVRKCFTSKTRLDSRSVPYPTCFVSLRCSGYGGKTQATVYITTNLKVESTRDDSGFMRQEPQKMKTYSPKASELTHKWYLIDAKDKVLGRLATEIATRLRESTRLSLPAHG